MLSVRRSASAIRSLVDGVRDHPRRAGAIAAIVVVLGFGWSLVGAVRGVESVARWSRGSESARARWLYDWNSCMEAQLHRAVPAGARVRVAGAPDHYFEQAVRSFASDRYAVVKKRGDAQFDIFVVPASEQDPNACPHRPGRGPWPLGIHLRLQARPV